MPNLASDPLLALHGTGSSLYALTVALEQRDPYTDEHCDRVCALAQRLGHCFDLDRDRLANLALAARFHDIGKIGVRDTELLYPGRLDQTQKIRMRAHPELGEKLFLATGRDDAVSVARLIRHHHESWDGSGYPDGLAGEAIPLEARILTVADAFDAMTSVRPYRPPMAARTALAVLEQESGAQVDPEVCRQLRMVLRRDPEV